MFGWLTSKKNNVDPIVETSTKNIPPANLKKEKVSTLKTEKLTIDQSKYLSNDEIIKYLKKYWKISNESSIIVYGKINSNYNQNMKMYFHRLINIRNNNGEYLEYPMKNLVNKETMKTNGVFLSPSSLQSSLEEKLYTSDEELYISCQLILSSENERKKHNNPLMLMVNTKTIKLLEKIPHIEVLKQTNGDVLVEDSIIRHYVTNNKETLDLAMGELNKKRIKKEEELNLLKNEYDKIEQSTQENKSINDNFLLGIKEKKEERKSLINEVDVIKKQIDMEKEMYEKNIREFGTIIKEKANSLLKLGFINEDQHAVLTENYSKQVDETIEFLDFNKDLNSSFSEAVSHIQAYLFSKNIIYRRSLLEDYFALLKTNDLIILAGDSGSGKTNLVKKFAESVGGIAKIIPVKPNWTSSDDLLGYYNPLQKTYLSEPFLEALLEAKNNPDTPYFICLDEMNLARVEYYFADFLSLLEERGEEQPKMFLYSDGESSHVESELNMVLSLIESTKKDLEKENIDSFIDILKDKEINQELKRVFGFSDKDSLIKYHSDLKRMLSGMLSTPSSIDFPKNVRIIGTVNIDETTHYLSPKILDRAHVIKLNSPSLLDWKIIENEVKNSNIKDDDLKKIIKFDIADFGKREVYPEFDPNDDFCKDIFELSEKFLQKMGAEISLRSIRQGLNYNQIFTKFNSSKNIAFYNFILHKILPKFTSFDGNSKINGEEKIEIMKAFRNKVKEIDPNASKAVVNEINIMLKKAEENDGIVSYWV